ncbi:enolase C-terminal domain-like protein [Cupriavidus basilensis]
MATAPLVLLDIKTSSGIAGSAYIFTYTPLVLRGVVQVLKDILPVMESWALEPKANIEALRRRFVLIGTPGLLDMALAAIDMALWDAHSRVIGLPLVRVLGGTPSRTLAYASFGMEHPNDAAPLIRSRRTSGLSRHQDQDWVPNPGGKTLRAVRAARALIGTDAKLMVDYNQSLSVPESIRRGEALDEEGIEWIEEPTRYDDFAGHAKIAAAVRTPIQLGENLYGPREVLRSIQQASSDLMMLDLMKIGGVSGWLDASAVCAATAIPVSTHFFQEASAHLQSLTPTAHYLEYFGLADAVLLDPLAGNRRRCRARRASRTGHPVERRRDPPFRRLISPEARFPGTRNPAFERQRLNDQAPKAPKAPKAAKAPNSPATAFPSETTSNENLS